VKRLAFAVAVVAVIVYIVDNAYHFMWEEEDANAAKVIASIGQTAPGWQR
jgi:hypothetical protein